MDHEQYIAKRQLCNEYQSQIDRRNTALADVKMLTALQSIPTDKPLAISSPTNSTWRLQPTGDYLQVILHDLIEATEAEAAHAQAIIDSL